MMSGKARCLCAFTAVLLLGYAAPAAGAGGAGEAKEITSVKELHEMALDVYRAAFEREMKGRGKMFALAGAETETKEMRKQVREEKKELKRLEKDVRSAQRVAREVGELVGYERWFENEVVQTPHLGSDTLTADFEAGISDVGGALQAYAAALSSGVRETVEERRRELEAAIEEFRFFCEKLEREVEWKMWHGEWEGYKEDAAVADKIKLFDEKCAA